MKKKLPYVIGTALIFVSLGIWFVTSYFTCLMNDCNSFIQSGSEYCESHTCRIDGCKEQKSREDLYCYIHGCSENGCVELAIENEGRLNYCAKHQCKVDGCALHADVNGYCRPHTCGDIYCDKPNKDYEYNSYCSEHMP